MKALTIWTIGVLLIVAAFGVMPSAAQDDDDLEATISALQTQVSEWETRYDSLRERYDRLNEQGVVSGDSAAPTTVPVIDAQPAPYTIITEDLQDGMARPRWIVEIVIPEGTDEEIGVSCAQVVREYLDRGGAEVTLLFGFSAAEQIGLGFDRCRASGSNDGQGYSGDGFTIFREPDDGTIQVEVGSAIGDSVTFSFPRNEE